MFLSFLCLLYYVSIYMGIVSLRVLCRTYITWSVYMYVYIYMYMYIQVHARRDAAAGWRPRSPPFVGRFHTMDLDSFRKGIKEEFFQSSSSFQAHIQHKALDTGTLMDSPALRALCVFMHYKLARTHRCSACKSRCILTFDSG